MITKQKFLSKFYIPDGRGAAVVKEGLKSVLQIGSAQNNELATQFKIAQISHDFYFSEHKLQLIFISDYSKPKEGKIF